MSDNNLTLTVHIGKLSLRIDGTTKDKDRLDVIIADKGANVMSVPLSDLVQAVKVINELGEKYYSTTGTPTFNE